MIGLHAAWLGAYSVLSTTLEFDPPQRWSKTDQRRLAAVLAADDCAEYETNRRRRKQIEVTGNKDELDNFYAALKRGLTVETFLRQCDEIQRFVHSHDLTEDYRLARGRVKKLCDEVTPVARFVKNRAKLEDWISFTMDNQYPDCVVCHQGGCKREIEVTIAQARERFNLMKELNETGTGRGFIGVTDDAPSQEFKDAMERERRAYSTDEVVGCIEDAIELCAQNKKLHRGNTLLIEADLWILPSTRWEEFPARFTEKVKALKFREVYLTGRGDNGDICLKIK